MAIATSTVEALKPKIFAMFAQASRPTFSAIRALDTDYSTQASMKGAVITTPIDGEGDPADMVDVAPAMVPPNADAPEYRYHHLELNQFKHVHFELEHKELYEVVNGVIPSAIRKAANSFARYMNREVCRLYQQIPFYAKVGNAFDSDDLADIQMLDREAAEQEMPMDGRRLILGSSAFSGARSNARLQDYDKVGRPPGMADHAFFASRGYQFFLDQQVPTHTTGTRTGAAFLTNGAVAKGDTSITVDAQASTVKKGDIIAVHKSADQDVNAHEQVVGAVSEDVASNGTTIKLFHGAERAVPDNTRLVIVNQGNVNRQNLLVTPGALKIAVRPVLSPIENPNEAVEQDPHTGLPVVMSVWQGFKQVHWSFSILFGLAVVQPHRCLRLISN